MTINTLKRIIDECNELLNREFVGGNGVYVGGYRRGITQCIAIAEVELARCMKQTDEPLVKNTVKKKSDLTCEKCVMSGDKETMPNGNERVYCKEYDTYSNNYGILTKVRIACPVYGFAKKVGLFDFRKDRE